MSYHFLSLCCDLIQEQWPHADTCQDPKPKAQRLSGTFCTTATDTGARAARAGASGTNFRQNGCIAMMQLGNEVQKHGDTWDAVQRGEGRQTSHAIWYSFHICIGYNTGKSLSLSINMGELLWYDMLWLGQTTVLVSWQNHGNLLYSGTWLILLRKTTCVRGCSRYWLLRFSFESCEAVRKSHFNGRSENPSWSQLVRDYKFKSYYDIRCRAFWAGD